MVKQPGVNVNWYQFTESIQTTVCTKRGELGSSPSAVPILGGYMANIIENVVVKNSKWKESDIEMLFGDEEVHFTEANDLPTLMVELDIFPSKSEARRAKREGPIPTGWTDEFKASKKRRLWIWNPTE